MNCIAIDDEPLALQVIETYMQKLSHVRLVNTFRNPLSALEYIQKNSVDLILLDINMPEINGLQFLKTISKGQMPILIFTTAYSEYALESYDYQAVDYLLKPIEFGRFLRAINKAQEIHILKHIDKQTHKYSSELKIQQKLQNTNLLIRSNNKYHKLNTDELVYIESVGGNYLAFHLTTKKLLSIMKLQDLIQQLPTNFVRIHRSHIININYIETIDNFAVTLNDHQHTELSIGMYYRSSLKQLIENLLNSNKEEE